MAEYGVPIYITINASNNKDVIMDAIGKAVEEKYNTKPSNIKDIVLRRSWRHI